jgi:methylmalonyl-CoA mutase
VARTTIEAMSAVLGGTQSLHTNAFDEAIALPTDFSAKIARDTQLYIQRETDVTRAIDPWAGSWYVEQLTAELVEKAWALIQEVEQLGGMAKAIEEGLPKLRIEEAAAAKQARIDSGSEKIIGVNIFQNTSQEPFEILEVDNSAVRDAQVRRIASVRESRDSQAVEAALAVLASVAATGREICSKRPLRQRAHALRSGRYPLPWKKPSAAMWPPPSLFQVFMPPI